MAGKHTGSRKPKLIGEIGNASLYAVIVTFFLFRWQFRFFSSVFPKLNHCAVWKALGAETGQIARMIPFWKHRPQNLKASLLIFLCFSMFSSLFSNAGMEYCSAFFVTEQKCS